MVIKKFLIVASLCSMQAIVLFANAWTLVENEEKTVLTDETGKTCEIFSDTGITDASLERIESILNTLWAIPGLSGTQGRVRIEEGNYFHFIIYPDTLLYRQIDLKQYLPSGLSFRYDSTLFYDVTLKVDDYLPRVSGAYIDPNDFLEQLYTTTVLPEHNLQGEVLLQRIARLENALMALSKKSAFTKPSEVSEEIVLAVITLNNQNPNISVSEALKTLKGQGLDVSKKDVEAVFMVYLGKFE